MPFITGGSSGGGAVSATAFAPQLSGLVCSGAAPWWFLSSFKVSANQALGTRVVVPSAGTLHDFAVLINGVATPGNIDVGIYSLAAEPRARLWHSGPVAIPTTGWQVIGDPALTVTQGQILDFVYSLDTNNSLDCGGIFNADVYAGQLPSSSFWPVPNASTFITYTVNAAAYPLPTTIPDASCHRATFVPCIMARVA